VLGIDFNPQAVERWRSLGLEARFGDATDPEFISDLPLRGTRWMVSTVPVHATGVSHADSRRTLIELARSVGFGGRVAVTSHSSEESAAMSRNGADMVLEPFQDAADQAVDLLCGAVCAERTRIPQLSSEAPLDS